MEETKADALLRIQNELTAAERAANAARGALYRLLREVGLPSPYYATSDRVADLRGEGVAQFVGNRCAFDGRAFLPFEVTAVARLDANTVLVARPCDEDGCRSVYVIAVPITSVRGVRHPSLGTFFALDTPEAARAARAALAKCGEEKVRVVEYASTVEAHFNVHGISREEWFTVRE